QLWPREMAPGYYEAVIAACRNAGFEPDVDEHAAGSTVWGALAGGRGFGLVVESLRFQLPPGLALVELQPPAPTMTLALGWPAGRRTPAVDRLCAAATRLASHRGWL